MIVNLTIENFKAFLDATTITFAAGTTSALQGNLLRRSNGENFVKSMAFYGHNASGKTTVLDAIYALRAFVVFSGQDQKPTSRIPCFEAFALDQAACKRPSRVAVTIDLNGDRFAFDVSATAKKVWSETLSVQYLTKQPSRKTPSKVLIERVWDPERKRYTTTIDRDLGNELTRNAVIEQTPSNRLMVGKLASLNNDVARRLMEWFDDDLSFYDMHRNPYAEDAMLKESARLLKEDSDFAGQFIRFIKDADTGIQELKAVNEKSIEAEYSDSNEKLEFKEVTKPSLLFRHATKDGSEVIFHRQRESSGTLRFVALIAAVLRSGPRPRVVCIDELSASMHPELVRRLIRIVHTSSYNSSGNQLLFTTHDTHLMDPKELLRRDQITLCGKDRFGQSTTVRLDSFQDGARSDANLQKQYLQGRFGGLPLFGPTLEDIPVDDKPLEVGT